MIRRINDTARQLDSCRADGLLLTVQHKEVKKENAILKQEAELKDQKIITLETKVKNRSKIGVLLGIVSAILTTILIL